MKKLISILFIFLPYLVLHAQSTVPVPVVGNINTVNGVPAGANNYLEFTLVNCGNTQPTVNGVAVVSNSPVDFYPGTTPGTLVNQDGVTPAALYGNDIIACGNIGNTSRYSEQQYVNSQPSGPSKYYFVQSGTGLSFNINTANPIYVLPPLKYPNPTQCGTGQYIIGTNNDLSPICANLPSAASNAVVQNPSGNQSIVQPSGSRLSINGVTFDSSGNLLTPLNATDGVTVTGGPITAASSISKLPRVDVTHADFGSGIGYISSIIVPSGVACTSAPTVHISAPNSPTSTMLVQATGKAICVNGNVSTMVYLENKGLGYLQAGTTATLTGGGITVSPTLTVTAPPCNQPADPTGTADSTCAIQNAIDWAYGQSTNYTTYNTTSVYFPRGKYLISSAIFVPTNLVLRGDGKFASMLVQTTNSANGIDVRDSGAAPATIGTSESMGGISDLGITALNTYMHSGTLLELNVAGYSLDHILLINSGGRGIESYGGTERVHGNDVEIDNVRFPFKGPGNEGHYFKLNIGNPNALGSASYSTLGWGDNCLGGLGTDPSASAPSAATNWAGACPIAWTNTNQLTLQSWIANGTTLQLTLTCPGGCPGGHAGISPIFVGNYFTVNGLVDTSGGTAPANGTYQVTAVTNNTGTGSNSFIITSLISVTGQCASSCAGTFQPALVPNTYGAVMIYDSGNFEFNGGSVKPTYQAIPFKALGGFGPGTISHQYWEAPDTGGQPSTSSEFVSPGVIEFTKLAGPTPSGTGCSGNYLCLIPVSGGHSKGSMWMPDVTDDPVYTVADAYYLYPADYNPGSSAASLYTPSVNQNQREEVIGYFDTSNNFYMIEREGLACTAPACTAGGTQYPAWSVGSFLQVWYDSGVVNLEDIHPNSLQTQDTMNRWTANCADSEASTSIHTCGTLVLGAIPDGSVVYPMGQTGVFSYAPPSVSLNAFEFSTTPSTFASSQEAFGKNWVKCHWGCSLTVTDPYRNPQQLAETAEADNGSLTMQSIGFPAVGVKYSASTNGVSGIYLTQKDVGFYEHYLGTTVQDGNHSFTQIISQAPLSPDPALMPSVASGVVNQGMQHSNSWCQFDLGTTTSNHANYRWCFDGGPLWAPSGGSKGKGSFHFDVYSTSTSTWTNAFSVQDTGSNTANLTVTGATALQALTVGGASIKPALIGTSAAWNNSGTAIPANSCVAGPTAAITGLTAGMAISVTPSANPGIGLNWSGAYVSTAGNAAVEVCNTTAAAITPVSTTYNFRVQQ